LKSGFAEFSEKKEHASVADCVEASRQKLAPVFSILSSLSAAVVDLRSEDLMDRLEQYGGRIRA
jgi:hypothetical protein